MQAKEILQALYKGVTHQKQIGKVLVVGAGTAGLATAQMLHKSGIEVQVLEATNRYGGRVHTLSDFAKTPIEAGAEFVHGTKSVLFELAELHRKARFNIEAYEDVYYFKNRLWSEREAYTDEDFGQLDKVYNLLEEADFSEDKDFIPMTLFLEVINCPVAVRHLVEARLGLDYGTSLDKIDAQALQKAMYKWYERYANKDGGRDANYVFEKAGLLELLELSFPDALPVVQFEKPITQINYGEKGVTLRSPTGETWEGDAVVLTVPMGVLKKYLITFSPALPAEKTQAIETIGIDAGVKILLQFSRLFWTPETGGLMGGNRITEFYPSGKDDEPVLTGLVMGDKAQHLSEVGEQEAINIALQELDMMLGTTEASSLFIKGKMVDWGNTPFQWGAYSYPSFQSEEAREVLAQPLPPLYFAGEATHTGGHFATVHGAIETAYRAVCELLL